MDRLRAFCRFEWLIAPVAIKLLFWLSLFVWWIWGFRALAHGDYLYALYQFTFWPLVSRVIAEALWVFFRAHTRD